MHLFFILLLMTASGFGLGVIYFAILMKTMNTFMTRKHWKSVMVASFAVRAFLLLGCFILLSDWDWQRMVALVFGFMIARLIMVHRVKNSLPLRGKKGAA